MKHPIEASACLVQPLRRVRAVLNRDLGLLVGAEVSAEGSGGNRFEGSLAVDLGSSTLVQQAIVGEIGPTTWADDALLVPVRWQPAGHEHLLPTFEGEFELTVDPPGTRLVLRGSYRAPLGPAGRAGDWVAGRRLAKRSLARLLESVAVCVDDAAKDATEPAREEQAGPGPENFIG